jgi:hypothetical protein
MMRHEGEKPPGTARHSIDLAELRGRFADRLAAVETAAREWGIRPDYPEGVFVSAMIATQAGFGELALALAEELHDVVHEARATAEEELARQRVITHRTRLALEDARGAIENLELEKEKVTARLVERIVPDMIRGTREALVIHARRRSLDAEVGRLIGVGAVMLALVLFGYGWGTWSDWGLSKRVEVIGMGIERCQVTSKWTDDQGHRLCELSDFAQQ